MMKPLFLVGLCLLAGCSATQISQPVADQQADLLDQDDDGVINARDNCADTPAGSEVDNYGCPHEFDTRHLQEMLVFFDHDSSVIKQHNKPYIRKLAQKLSQSPTQKILLAGHASEVGSDAYNNALALRRANAIRDLLVEYGVHPEQIEVTSYGSFKHLVEGFSEQAHSANRRVFFATESTESNLVSKWHIFLIEDMDKPEDK